MSERSVPNLDALLAALPPGSAGAQAAAVFDADSLATARERLRSLLVTWEHEHAAANESAA